MADDGNGRALPNDMILRVRDRFLIYTPTDIGQQLEAIPSDHSPYVSVMGDAASGLRRVISAGSLPFQLSFSAIQQRRFDALLNSERIRRLPLPSEERNGLTVEDEEAAYSAASSRMRQFVESGDGSTALMHGVVRDLNNHLRSTVVSSAAYELLAQTVVSTWSIFEVFCTDFIIAFVNHNPTRTRDVIERSDLKAYFGKPSLDIALIGEHGFDLSFSMGTLLFHNKRLDNLTVIKSVLKALFDDGAVFSALGDEMWLLNQRRHLIVHKRGIVDKEYLSRTSDTVPLGQQLRINAEDAISYIQVVERAIIAIYEAATLEVE